MSKALTIALLDDPLLPVVPVAEDPRALVKLWMSSLAREADVEGEVVLPESESEDEGKREDASPRFPQVSFIN